MGSTTTKYLLNGTQILAQTTNGITTSFFYDQQGNRVAMADGSNNFYYYLYNIQGDVVALADASTGKLAATYTYDAWGKCTVTNASGYTIGTQNPFRYRGYYYDTETGLYYLNSRYYDPEVGRFISVDCQLNGSVLGYNMFTYCENNPVNNADVSGQSPIGVLGLADYAAIHAIVQYKCAKNYGWYTEIYVKGRRGRGYLDLFDKRNHSYYEVKSSGAYKRSSTTRQMRKYDVAVIADTARNRNKFSSSVIGSSINRGTKNVYGRFQYGIYDVKYRLQSPGLIVYEVKVNWERATVVATVAVFAVLLAAYPAGAPAYAYALIK